MDTLSMYTAPDPLEYHPNTQDADGGRTVYFDMDGTLADLYGVHDVFKRLDSNDVTVYLEAEPISKYVDMLKEFKAMGYMIGIITAGSRFPAGTPDDIRDKMNEDTAEAKQQWLHENGISPYIDSFQFVPYGVSKYEVAKDKTGILVDNDDRVLNTWYSDRIKAINDYKAIH